MKKTLDDYYAKRDFSVTPEPRGGKGRKSPRLAYVIQKHAARRLHYDFRLELDGVLKSWAVPKGPSLDPTDKRMAVHVEDHPLDYGSFEGIIPPNQYGAGTVIVWDRGEWRPLDDPHEGYRKGKLKFELHGEKLSGVWNLVRMKRGENERQESWLLIKENDDAARAAAEFSIVDALPDSVLTKEKPKPAGGRQRATEQDTRGRRNKNERMPAEAVPAKLPLTLAPQLATLVTDTPRRGDWIYEVKYDGYRILTRFQNGTPRLFTRNGNDWTARLKVLAAALKGVGIDEGWLDGEIVVLGSGGNPDFQALQNAFENARTNDIRYFIFDLPFYERHDLRAVPLYERRELLKQLLSQHESDRIGFSDDFPVPVGELLNTACEMKLEGVIGKLRDSPYESKRSPSWIKLKCTERQEFVIGGYTEPKHAGRGVGALLVGIHEADGSLRYAGKVGTGFTDQSGSMLAEKLEPLTVDADPFDNDRELARQRHRGKLHWVKLRLMAEISFHEWTNDGHIRHAVFHGLRSDKPPRAIVRERPTSATVAEAASDDSRRARDRTRPSPSGKAVKRSDGALDTLQPRPDLAGVRITHPDRVIDKRSGATKLDLANYYAMVADRLLPHLADRPVSLVRGPSGVDSKLFFQKHIGTLKLGGVRELDPAHMPGHPPLVAIDSRRGLIGAVQMSVIEFHTWNAIDRDIDRPDRIVFDLDPGEGVTFQQVIEGTEATHIFLEEIGLRNFLKTSGGKGLHIVVPLQRRYGWDEVKDFARACVEHLAGIMPDRFVAKSGPRNRVGRIFIDYLRNGRGATTAAAFSVRARPGLGVSMPVDWEALPDLTAGDQWRLDTAIDWLDSQSEDPWADYDQSAQPLGAAMRKLGFKPAGKQNKTPRRKKDRTADATAGRRRKKTD